MRKNKIITKSILVILLAISPLTPILSNVHGDNFEQHTFQGAKPINELFPDENLARVIVAQLDVADSSVTVTANQLQTIRTLDAKYVNIKDLTGCQYLHGVINIMLGGNQISDLSPIANLTSLVMLEVEDNEISDLSPIANLTSLNIINVENNAISDVSPLHNIPLNIAKLDGNHIADLTPLKLVGWIEARSQTIALPEIPLGLSTNIILLDRDGTTPTVTITDGSYDGRELTWSQSGQNEMHWVSDNNLFSGVVTQTVVYADRIIDYFPDENLAQRIAIVLNGNDNVNVSVSEEQLANITDLSIVEVGVTNLEGMQFLTGLRTLEIVGTEVSDIHPIGGLINLISLDLRNNEIENINPLSNLTNLRILFLDRNKVEDISALSTLVDLTDLKLASNQITDVTPLKDLNNLHILNLNGNHIMDISSLPQVASTIRFSALNQSIILDNGYLLVPQKINLLNQYGEYPSVTYKIGAGTFVDGLLTWTETTTDGINMLEWIGPGSFQGVLEQKVEPTTTIYDLFEDENLAKAIALTLNNNEANAVVDIEQLKEIETLNIASRHISNLSGMQHLEGLKFLNASVNDIYDLSPLAGLTELQTLNLNFNNLSDITPLENMKKLTHLSLNNNALTDISILSDGFNNLTTFTAISQIVNLPGASVGMSTPLTLLDKDSNVPTINYVIGAGNYDSASNMLTWTTEGENYLRWASTTNFSGVLSQRVNSVTIKELFPDENLAQVIATRLGKDNINAAVTFNELASITNLAAPNRGIHSLEGVQYLTNLRELSVFLNQITDITPTRNLNSLTAVYLGYNQIEDISALAQLDRLDVLDVNHNKISDVSLAANLPSLTRLRFSYNRVTDISSLGGIVADLREINASNQIIDLPTVVVGVSTPITIRDAGGFIPMTIFNNGDGEYKDGQLIWSTAGENSFRWTSNYTFSGLVRQTVNPN